MHNFIVAQGWSSDTALSVALAFIEEKGLSGDALRYFEKRAESENSEQSRVTPINLRQAMEDHESELGNVYLCEVGFFDSEDPSTAYKDVLVLGIGENASDASEYAIAAVKDTCSVNDSDSLDLMGVPQQIEPEDYYTVDGRGYWVARN